MDIHAVKAMVAEAKKNGIAEIVYNGMNSGGLYSSSSSSVEVFLTRYPECIDAETLRGNFVEGLKRRDSKFTLDNYLDEVEVCEGFLKVTVRHLRKVSGKDDQRADDIIGTGILHGRQQYEMRFTECSAGHCGFNYMHCRTSKDGEKYHTILIPFENIVAILC